MAFPAVLHLFILTVFLLDYHVRVNLFHSAEALCLNDLKVNGCFRPLVVKQLICFVFVNQRDGIQTGKNIIT